MESNSRRIEKEEENRKRIKAKIVEKLEGI